MSIITITTDFGVGSPYVAEMKGVILGINPKATIVDVTHDIAPQSIFQAAFVVTQSVASFPKNSTHMVVVDPGVGTERKVICAQIGDWNFVCPDNGILTLLTEKYPLHAVRELDNPEFWRPEISNTFHGRDVMSPVAAHLSIGADFDSLGKDCEKIVKLEFPIPRFQGDEVRGEIIWIDSFGNLVTNIDEDSLSEFDYEALQVSLGFHTTKGLAKTFGERGEKQLVAYIGSGGYLEIATVNENAQEKLAARVGDAVSIRESSIE